MKKHPFYSVLICIMAISVLPFFCGCAEPEEQEVILHSEGTDMSAYYWLEDDDPSFIQVTLEESLRLFDEKGDGILFYSYTTCRFCNNAVPVLNEIAREYNTPVYYIDVYGQDYSDWPKEERTALMDHFMECIEKTTVYNPSSGEREFNVPAVMTVIDGEIKAFHISLTDDYTGTDRLTEKQTEELKEIYRGLFDVYQLKDG